MSSAALARKRRANMPTNTSSVESNQKNMSPAPPSQPRVNMTIPQILNVFDKRIAEVEKRLTTQSPQNNEKSDNDSKIPNNMSEIINEYEERFEMLLTQINQMKDILNTLQMYTMTVNKTLLERSGVLGVEELNMLHPVGDMNETKNRLDDTILTSLEEQSTNNENENENDNTDLG